MLIVRSSLIALVTALLISTNVVANSAQSPDDEYVVVQSSNDLQLEFCKQLIGEAFSRIGKKVKVLHMPSERAIQMASEGKVDGDCFRVSNIVENIPNLVVVPEHIAVAAFIAYSIDIKELPEGWASLKPYRVATPSGWKLIEWNVEPVAPRQVLKAVSAKVVFELVSLGRADIGVADMFAATQHIKHIENGDKILPIHPPLETVPLYLLMNNKHEDLVEPLSEAIAEMKDDGTWYDISFSVFGFEPIE